MLYERLSQVPGLEEDMSLYLEAKGIDVLLNTLDTVTKQADTRTLVRKASR